MAYLERLYHATSPKHLHVKNIITGAGGFLGQHLIERLSGDTMTIPHDHIQKWGAISCDNFFFLSTYGNMAHQNELWKILMANVTDLVHVLRRIECQSFVYVSSSSVTLPVQTAYSRTKRAAEEMVLAMPVPGCVVRPYSITGVGEQKEHLIPTLIRSCMEGEAVDLVYEPTHDFVDVSDVADGLVELAQAKATGVFEFGRGVAISNEEVLRIVEAACGRSARVRRVDNMRNYDTQEWYCRDLSKRGGWQPKKSLATSIEEMLEAYRAL